MASRHVLCVKVTWPLIFECPKPRRLYHRAAHPAQMELQKSVDCSWPWPGPMTHENLYTWLPQLNRTWKLQAWHTQLSCWDWHQNPHLGFDGTTEWLRKLQKPSRHTKTSKRPLNMVRGHAKIRQDPGTEWYWPRENIWHDVHGLALCFSLYSLFVSYLYFIFCKHYTRTSKYSREGKESPSFFSIQTVPLNTRD
jgi:hypothetical protein